MITYDKIHDNLFTYLESKPKKLLFAFSGILTLVIGVLDNLSGLHALAILYVIPVFLCSCFVGRLPGLNVVIVWGGANIIVFAGEALNHKASEAHLWRLLTNLCYMLLLHYMFSNLKEKLGNQTTREQAT